MVHLLPRKPDKEEEAIAEGTTIEGARKRSKAENNKRGNLFVDEINK